MHINHHGNITKNTKIPKQPKLGLLVRIAWRIILRRQAVHEENPEDWV